MATDREPEVLWSGEVRVDNGDGIDSRIVAGPTDDTAQWQSRLFRADGEPDPWRQRPVEPYALRLLAAERSRLERERGEALEALRLSAEALTAVDRCTLYGPADVAREKIAAAVAAIRELARLEAGGEANNPDTDGV